MITSNVFQRVFLVTFGNSLGTAFAIDVDGRQYLVTARHVAKGNDASGPLALAHQGVMEPVKTIGEAMPPDGSIDVIVFALEHQIAPSYACEPTMKGLTWGQDTYFLGFPFGLQGSPSVGGRPLPLVKHAQHSGAVIDEHGNNVIVLDGLNVPGMSGGPIVFRPGGSGEFQIAGVVQAYLQHPAPILDANGARTKMTVVTNPGVIYAYDIIHAVEAARRLGNGATVT